MYSGVVLVFPIGLGIEIGSTTSLGCPSGSARRESVIDRSRAAESELGSWHLFQWFINYCPGEGPQTGEADSQRSDLGRRVSCEWMLCSFLYVWGLMAQSESVEGRVCRSRELVGLDSRSHMLPQNQRVS